MRTLIAVTVIVLILVFVGWLKFGSQDGNPGVSVDTGKVRRDTEAVVESVEGAAQEIDDRVDIEIKDK